MCQNESSCVACCGTLNLRLRAEQLRGLLSERTSQCPDEGRADHTSLVAYRSAREEIEASLERYDATVYVCPFVGWIGQGRVGCLIHPLRTGRANSQNASFYGTTICQSYDCRAKEKEAIKGAVKSDTETGKEREEAGRHGSKGWQTMALHIAEGDALVYTRIIGDAMLYRLVEAIGETAGVFEAAPALMERLIRLRLSQDCGPTSFEIPGHSKPTVDDLIPVLFREEDQQSAASLCTEAIDAVSRSSRMQSKRMQP